MSKVLNYSQKVSVIYDLADSSYDSILINNLNFAMHREIYDASLLKKIMIRSDEKSNWASERHRQRVFVLEFAFLAGMSKLM